jgi:hypothetical protein
VDKDLLKIRKLVAFMRKEGVLSLKMEGIELNLAQAALLPDEPSKKSAEPEPTQPDQTQYTDLDWALWSAPGLQPDPEAMNA